MVNSISTNIEERRDKEERLEQCKGNKVRKKITWNSVKETKRDKITWNSVKERKRERRSLGTV